MWLVIHIDEYNFPHKIQLINAQVCKAFANN